MLSSIPCIISWVLLTVKYTTNVSPVDVQQLKKVDKLSFSWSLSFLASGSARVAPIRQYSVHCL